MGRLRRAVVSVALVALVAAAIALPVATDGGMIPNKSDLRSLLWKPKLHRSSDLPPPPPQPTSTLSADKGPAKAKPRPTDLRPQWNQQLLQQTTPSKPAAAAAWKGAGSVGPASSPRPASYSSSPAVQPSANAIEPAVTGSPKPKLESTTYNRTIITAPLRRCPEGQRMGPDRQCRPDYTDPEDDD